MGDWFDSEGVQGRLIDINEVIDAPCCDLLLSLAQAGALVSFSTTSDGGAVGVTVTLDGRWRREYFRSCEELAEWLGGAHSAVMAARSETPTPAVQGSRRRRARQPHASL